MEGAFKHGSEVEDATRGRDFSFYLFFSFVFISLLCPSNVRFACGVFVRVCCLRYASEPLRGDRGVVTAALTQSGMALAYASAELRQTRDLALLAVRANEHAVNTLTRRGEKETGARVKKEREHRFREKQWSY